jgi:hypothetical protein
MIDHKILLLICCLTGALIGNGQSRSIGNYQLLTTQLDSIYTKDQKYRKMIEDVEAKHGYDSKEMKDLWKTINKNDSANLIQVADILEKYGWLGADAVGEQGNATIFLVIQHADLKTQEKYLPMMRQAVKNGKAKGSELALLEDRVAMRQGKKQIYGSQISRNQQTGKYFIAPIEDEPNVNKRRASVGLMPLEDYARHFNIEYKLPEK